MFKFGLIVLCLSSFVLRAGAQSSPALPFEEHELAEALSARIPGVPASDLRIDQVGAALVVRLGQEARVVDLGQARGLDAARVIALVVAEMAAQPSALAPAPPLPAPPRPAPAPQVGADRARAGIDAAVQRGTAAAEAWSFDLGISAVALVTSRLVLGARVGYWTSPTVHSRATGTAVYFDAVSVRPSVGLRFAMLELGAGPVLAPFWVRAGEGHRDMLAGANMHLALWLAVVGSLRLTARVQLDVLGNRTRLYAGDDPVVTTPRFMLGLALGFAWGWS